MGTPGKIYNCGFSIMAEMYSDETFRTVRGTEERLSRFRGLAMWGMGSNSPMERCTGSCKASWGRGIFLYGVFTLMYSVAPRRSGMQRRLWCVLQSAGLLTGEM
jgi:hypothetical protein